MNQQTKSTKANLAYQMVNGFLVLAIVFGGVGIISKYVRVFSPENRLQVAASIQPENIESLELPSELEAEQPFPITVNITDPEPLQILLSVVMDIAPWALSIALLLILRSFVGSIKEGDPFNRANVRRLRILGFVVMAFPLVQILNALLLGGVIDGVPNGDILNNAFSIDLSPLAGGLGVLVLAEVFSHGVSLREDVEGTV